ncbi:MAG: type II toxin-antitoxin system Phd/YefM family antitoxin, partial [Candidatus Electrothrix sp. AW2]|nr:type II toxin-antitoxin system Phd/YefM family antitoxin [Candidatus Electrothrix sp. AX1]MCI5136118.1 type II toxin-antitoxin system Phd/YefM family antitoxin [Candidatus Electrothrix gigas]
MITVNTHEAKTNLSKLLTLVAEKNETVKICRNGKVMAELVQPRSGKASPGEL